MIELLELILQVLKKILIMFLTILKKFFIFQFTNYIINGVNIK